MLRAPGETEKTSVHERLSSVATLISPWRLRLLANSRGSEIVLMLILERDLSCAACVSDSTLTLTGHESGTAANDG